jgi:hypothetical protein
MGSKLASNSRTIVLIMDMINCATVQDKITTYPRKNIERRGEKKKSTPHNKKRYL